jgi:hypothetical protein
VLFAVLEPGGPNRRILKYSYGDDFDLSPDVGRWRERFSPKELLYRAWSPDRRQFSIACPGAWRAASFHAEVAIPEELRIELAFLYDPDAEEAVSEADDMVNRAALYASEPISDEQDTIAYVELVPERSGHPFLAAATSAAVLALLWLGVASGLDAVTPGPAVSLLLAGAAVFSGLAASGGEHRLVKVMFASTRHWLAVVALAALAASATLAMEVPDAHPVEVWRIAAIACSVAALRVTWSAIRYAP